MGYKVTEAAGTLHFDGDAYEPGETVPVKAQKDIDGLLAIGAIEGDGKKAAADKPVDPAPVDPAPVDPAPVDPAPVDPAPVDPAPVDPAPVDPAPVDPGKSGGKKPKPAS